MPVYSRCEDCGEILEVSPNRYLQRIRHRFAAKHAKHNCGNGKFGTIIVTIEDVPRV